MKKHNLKKSQSIFEYICVTIVFATVGIAGFILANQAAASRVRGEVSTYKSNSTEMGKTLDDGLTKEEYEWPDTWSQSQAVLGGATPSDVVDGSYTGTLPVPKEEE